MYYEINVTLNGRHFFATAERSITDLATLKAVLLALKKGFTQADGYEMTVTEYRTVGRGVDVAVIFPPVPPPVHQPDAEDPAHCPLCAKGGICSYHAQPTRDDGESR